MCKATKQFILKPEISNYIKVITRQPFWSKSTHSAEICIVFIDAFRMCACVWASDLLGEKEVVPLR